MKKAKCQWFKTKLKYSDKKLKQYKDKECIQTKEISKTSWAEQSHTRDFL